MRRNYVIAISFITCLVGSRYYFGLTMLEGSYLKLCGMICLIISVLLGGSCLSYLPKFFSTRLNFYAISVLFIIQLITLFYFRDYPLEENVLGLVELIIPLVMILIGGISVIYLIIIKCKEIIFSRKKLVQKHSKSIPTKKKILTFKMKG